MSYKQEPPFAIQIEMTEGCNLMCDFCGINGIREKAGNYKHMTLNMADSLARAIAVAGWNSRIEFAMHGEPTINPHHAEIVGVFRNLLPKSQLMLTTNGVGLLKGSDVHGNTLRLFMNGLNLLAVDAYKHTNLSERVRQGLMLSDAYYKVNDYPKDGLDLSPHRRWPAKTRQVLFIEDINDANAGSHSSLCNHAGAAAPPNTRGSGKRCAKPFRELSVRWDGTIAICCNDWRGLYKIGNVLKKPLVELWQGPEFTAARKKLYHGQRDFGSCAGCDATTYRLGLLPDKLGRETMDLPSAADLKVIKRCCAGETLTQIVLRPWEK